MPSPEEEALYCRKDCYASCSRFSVALGERLLGMHAGEKDDSGKNKSLVESLSRQFHSHAYPVSRTEALDIGLAVNKERDFTLEDLMWDSWLDLEEELKERRGFSVVGELLDSPQAGKLLSPVPQLDLPASASAVMVQAGIPEVTGPSAAVMIDPVDYHYIDALMESHRLAYRGVTRGKILASRRPT